MRAFLRTLIALVYLISSTTAQAEFVINSYVYGAPGFDPNTIVLIHADGVDAATVFTDVANSPHTITTVGNAQVDTAQIKFGTASSLYDGSGDYLSMADAADLRPGSGDFTYEGWLFFTATTDFQTFWGKGYNAAGDVMIQTSGTFPVVYVSNVAVITSSTAISTSAWQHWALVRSGSTLTLYKDGTSVGTVANSTNLNGTAALTVGGSSGGAGAHSVFGNLDEFRYSNSARWTSNFTPDAAPYNP